MNTPTIVISQVEIYHDFPPYGDNGWKSVQKMRIKTDKNATFQEIGKRLDVHFGPKIAPFRYMGMIGGTGIDTSVWPHQFLAKSGKTLFLYDQDGEALLLGKE